MKQRIVTKNFVCAFISLMCNSFCTYILMSTMAEYVTSFGKAASIGGLITGLFIVGALFSRLYSGRGLEKHGWKKIGMVFSIIFLAACALYSFAPNLTALALIRFVHGFGSGALMNAILIIGVSEIPKERYGEGTGYFMMSTSLGVAIGPFMGGLIYDNFGGSGCFIASTICCLVIVIFLAMTDTRSVDPWYQRQETLKEENNKVMSSDGRADTGIKKRFDINDYVEVRAIPVSFCILFLCFGYSAMMSFYRLYAQFTGLERQFRSFFIIYALMLIVSRPAAGKIQDRWGDNAVCYPCITAQAVGLFLVAWKPCMLTIVICALFGALGYGTLNSVLNVIVNRNVTDERRSFAISTYWAFSDLGLGVAPAILGLIASVSDYRVLFYAAAFISLAALPTYFLVWGRSLKRKG